jgi:CheY-like chemotaxis protein
VLPGPRVTPAADDPQADVAAALHEVSNALTILLGWVSAARTEPVDPLTLRHALQVIEEQARIARRIARNATGAEQDSVDLDEPLGALVGAAVDALSVEASAAGVRIQVEARGPGCSVARASEVRQILTNLLLNALAFAPRGSQVRVEVGADATMAIVNVQDEGPGVDADRRARIFEGDSTRRGGAGIGLRHGRSLARAAGGDLDLVPSPSGARFRLAWPLARSRSIAAPAARKAAILDGTRVLVLEDDEHVTDLLGMALEARGAIVTIARNREELARALAAGQHDAALIDLSPIAADVHGAVVALRQSSPSAALVFISGSSARLPDALAGEGALWVRKPFEIGEVVAAVLTARGNQAVR